jgi:hypothetical protein
MKKILLCLALMAGAGAANAQSKGQMSRRIDSTSIPADVLSKQYTLLVHCPNSQKSWLKDYNKVMQEHYSGSFEVIPWNTNIAAAYSDSSKYRYVLVMDQYRTNSSYTSSFAKDAFNPSGQVKSYLSHRHIYLYDRKTGKRADSGLEAQNDLKILAYYADRMSGKTGDDN